MTKEEMNQFIRIDHPITNNSVEVMFKNGENEVGFFTAEKEDFNSENKWRIVPNNTSIKYKETNSIEWTRIINGDDVLELNLIE